MSTSWKALAVPLVAAFEGCQKKVSGMIHPYLDKLARPPVWTRGYGRTYGITESSGSISPEEALRELGTGLEQYAGEIARMAPGAVRSPAALAACASWAWNCGLGAFRHSRLRRAVSEARWADAIELIKTPRTAGGVVYQGLVRRRDAEAALLARAKAGE